MVPLYLGDYLFGKWLLYSIGIDAMNTNPSWMSWINEPLQHYTGISGISFWAFMVGGNLLGIFFSVILYPVLLFFFHTVAHHINAKNKSINTDQK